MKRLVISVALAVVLTAAAPPDPVTWKFQEAAKAVKPGAKFQVKVLAAIEPGWHLYSLKPMAEGPIATRIWIGEGQPFTLAGAIQASEPATVQDPALNMEVEMYEGEAAFTLPVVAGAGPAGAQKLIVSASYQSCNNRLCLPPKTVRIELPVNVTR